MTIRTRPLELADVRSAAILHGEAFPGFFLSALGPAFLAAFYRGFVTDRDAVTVVATDDAGELLGVVVGSTQPSGFFRRLLVKHWLRFVSASALAVLRRPASLLRLVRAVVYRGDVPIEVEGALLSSICVSPRVQARGVGRTILDAWIEEVEHRGVRAAYLTTDREDNAAANDFYRGAGWILAGSYTTREGRGMNCYRWTTPALALDRSIVDSDDS